MTTFRVGQRVKRARPYMASVPAGETGTVTACGALGVGVRWDSYLDPTFRFYAPETLEPLIDPKADAFIESLRKLGREPAPLERLAVGVKP